MTLPPGKIVLTNSIVRVINGPYVFDPAKDAINIAKHGLSLADFRGFDDDPVLIVDARFDYGETRLQARGRIDGRGYCVVLTYLPKAVRIISFRRAHEKELKRYG